MALGPDSDSDSDDREGSPLVQKPSDRAGVKIAGKHEKEPTREEPGHDWALVQNPDARAEIKDAGRGEKETNEEAGQDGGSESDSSESDTDDDDYDDADLPTIDEIKTKLDEITAKLKEEKLTGERGLEFWNENKKYLRARVKLAAGNYEANEERKIDRPGNLLHIMADPQKMTFNSEKHQWLL